MSIHRTPKSRGRKAAFGLLLAAALGCAGSGGCTWNLFGLRPPPPPPPPQDIQVVRGDVLVSEEPPRPGSPEARLFGARELFRRGEYSKAADLFHSLSDQKRAGENIVSEAIFYEAECYRLQARYPKAADLYNRLLKMAPSNAFREQAAQHLYEICDYWLDDTRTAMKQAREIRDHKRWFTTPRFLHFDKTKPLGDEEGRAIELLEQVHLADIRGDLHLGDKALFLCGAVHFFNENYAEADDKFSRIHESYPESPYTAQAMELAIISKHLSTGGSDYDGRKVAEARLLVDTALRTIPALAAKKEQFLTAQIGSITMQQAEKDFKIAEFYNRTGHPGSAWFYYDLVRLRYPGTGFDKLATDRMYKLKVKLEQTKGKGALPEITPLGAPRPAASQPQRPPVDTLPRPRPLPDRPPPTPPAPPAPLPSSLTR